MILMNRLKSEWQTARQPIYLKPGRIYIVGDGDIEIIVDAVKIADFNMEDFRQMTGKNYFDFYSRQGEQHVVSFKGEFRIYWVYN